MSTARRALALAAPLTSLAILLACSPAPTPTVAPKPVASASTSASAPASASASASASAKPLPVAPYGALDRATFHRLAQRLNLPIFWLDANGDGVVQPAEVRSLLFFPTAPQWTEGDKFTKAFEDAYAQLLAANVAPKDPPADAARRALVRKDLDDVNLSLVETDFTKASADDRAFVKHMLSIAAKVDALFAIQNGAAALASQVPADDLASQSLFRRNLGPKCQTPRLENDPLCSAIPGVSKVRVDVYPASLQADAGFCDLLGKAKNHDKLLDPFVALRDARDKRAAKAPKDPIAPLAPVPFSEAYAEPMKAIADELELAAKELADPSEEPLRAYLRAAAKAFRTNGWFAADEPWSKMTAENSRWFVRVGPDETYWEPCSQKAGFHLTFAKINRDSLTWQAKLKPHQQAMEDALAKLIGPGYKPQRVKFHLPDFIDVIVNAGDDRDAIGATVGQSLPNFGPVADQSRGRTVAMSNLYFDADSLRTRRMKAESLFAKESLARLTDDAAPSLLSTILHEATHNLGPSHEYRFAGRKDTEAFGGELASMLEELKAQSGALWFLSWGEQQKVFTSQLAQQTTLDSIVWCMGHIAQGMWQDGHRKPYSQLAAIQIGLLLDEGALRWDESALAANGKDKGAFVVVWDKVPAAVEKLMKTVATVKAKNDDKGARALADAYVDTKKLPQATIADRWLRFPSTSFVYAVDL
jgi:hypothetical protein